MASREPLKWGIQLKPELGHYMSKLRASLEAQLVKILPVMWKTWVLSLGWKDPLEKGKASHSSILAWRILLTRVHGFAKSWTQLSNFHLLKPF